MGQISTEDGVSMMATGDTVREIRRLAGLNQSEFWSRIGVTQSGGSRYESGRCIPKPVRTLITLAYGSEKEVETMLAKLREKGGVKPVRRHSLDE